MKRRLEPDRLIYAYFLHLIILMSLSFASTRGLVTHADGHMGNYVSEYLSSGSDDNIIIESSWLIFIVPFFLNLFRILNRINLGEYIVSAAAFTIQLIFLFSIELGSIIDTIISNRNYVVLFWTIGQLGAIFMLHKQFFLKKESSIIA